MKLCEHVPCDIELSLVPFRRSRACTCMNLCKYVSAQKIKVAGGRPGFKFKYYAFVQFVLGPCQRSRPYTGMKLCEHVPCNIKLLLVPVRRSRACTCMNMCNYVSAQKFKNVGWWPGFKFRYDALVQFVLGPYRRSRACTGMKLCEHVPCDIALSLGPFRRSRACTCVNLCKYVSAQKTRLRMAGL